MLIVGISGKRRSGKSLLASILVETYGFTAVSLADPLKAEVRDEYGLTKEHTDGSLKEVTDSRLGVTPRLIMIRHGKRRRDSNPTYWIDRLEQHILTDHKRSRKFVVSDIRFMNEADWIKRLGGYLVRLERYETLTGTNIDDPSETDLDNYGGFNLKIKKSVNINVSDLRAVARTITEEVGC